MDTHTGGANHFGVHLTIDGYNGSEAKLNDMELIFRFLDTLPGKLGMKNLTRAYVVWCDPNDKKDSGGWSGFVMINESHISVHTFPDKQFITADVYTCQNELETERILAEFKETFDLGELETNVIQRGKKFPVDSTKD